jgi:hypothetical protein
VKRVVATAVLLLVSLIAYATFMLTRPLATRNDVGMLVAGVLNGDAELASAVCGAPVRAFIYPTPKIEELRYGEWPWAKVSLDSWRPLLPREGSMTARVSGVGVDFNDKPLTPMVTRRLAFSYHCQWNDNGRSSNFVCTATSKPAVVGE